MFEKLRKKLKSRKGNSLAEFAITTAMMATLATTAAPKFGQVGAGAKEKRLSLTSIRFFLLLTTITTKHYPKRVKEDFLVKKNMMSL